jgi:hypothetical protein
MRDIFSEGLLYLDLLEIYGSTYAVAEICGLAQSNVFRGANSCAKLLNLGLAKDKKSGVYRIERNQDVQRDLRRLNQKMRAREHGQLRLVGAETLLSEGSAAHLQSRSFQLLPERWPEKDLSLDYLQRSLLDVVVTRAHQVRARFSWPPPVKRRDLFVPVDVFVATELCQIQHVLYASPRHPLVHSELLDELCGVEWLVDHQIAIEVVSSAYPSVSLRSMPTAHPGEGSVVAFIKSNPNLLMLSDPLTYLAIRQLDETFDYVPLSVDLGLRDCLLAVSLPFLVPEPMHQSLIRQLRDMAGLLPMASAVSPS